MKNCLTSVIIGSLLALGVLSGCEKKTDNDFVLEPSTAYMNLQVGKYVRYQLDSTVYVEFGQRDTIISYQAKDVVEGEITDNLGRPGYRIVRYLRDVKSTNEADWKPSLTYQVIPTNSTLEVLETNFRYVKMALPIRDEWSWKGNRFLPTFPYRDLFGFTNDNGIQQWDYTYQDVNTTLNINNTDYDSTLTVMQANDSSLLGSPVVNYWVEKYAKNIGLVYKDVRMWAEQPQNGQTVSYRHGFGIRMTIIDHN